VKGLLVVLHGSPFPEANDPVLQVVNRVRNGGQFTWCQIAYLECNEPSVSEGVLQAVTHGVRELVVVPCFLHPGRHSARDIPSILEECAIRYPQVSLWLGWPVGKSVAITDALLYRARQTQQ
jgi:sirohydrochlorin ferrochelatase